MIHTVRLDKREITRNRPGKQDAAGSFGTRLGLVLGVFRFESVSGVMMGMIVCE